MPSGHELNFATFGPPSSGVAHTPGQPLHPGLFAQNFWNKIYELRLNFYPTASKPHKILRNTSENKRKKCENKNFHLAPGED